MIKYLHNLLFLTGSITYLDTSLENAKICYIVVKAVKEKNNPHRIDAFLRAIF